MTRQRRRHEEWNIYHVMIRCNNQQMLLRKKEVKLLLINCFGKMQERIGYKIYGFVVMDNHAHWLLQVQAKHGLSGVMQKVLLSFGRFYREQNKFVGYFWQGRYKSIGVVTDHAMQEVIRYVHENPVKVNMVKRAEDYLYSSARRYKEGKDEFIDKMLVITKYGDASAGSSELLKV